MESPRRVDFRMKSEIRGWTIGRNILELSIFCELERRGPQVHRAPVAKRQEEANEEVPTVFVQKTAETGTEFIEGTATAWTSVSGNLGWLRLE